MSRQKKKILITKYYLQILYGPLSTYPFFSFIHFPNPYHNNYLTPLTILFETLLIHKNISSPPSHHHQYQKYHIIFNMKIVFSPFHLIYSSFKPSFSNDNIQEKKNKRKRTVGLENFSDQFRILLLLFTFFFFFFH